MRERKNNTTPSYTITINSINHKINRKAMIVAHIDALIEEYHELVLETTVFDSTFEMLEAELYGKINKGWEALEETERASVGDEVRRYIFF